MDIFRQMSTRVKGGAGRRSELLTRVVTCLVQGDEGGALRRPLQMQLSECFWRSIIECTMRSLLVVVCARMVKQFMRRADRSSAIRLSEPDE